MKILLFGATGMVGHGVLLACLDAQDVSKVRAVGRVATGIARPKLDEVVRADLFSIAGIGDALQPFDACFFCLGVSSFGMAEPEYTRLTYDLTLAIAEVLARRNPRMTFVYLSCAGTDASEHGKSMWARVKGRTENALRRLPFHAVYLFRPGLIQPVRGARSKVAAIRLLYVVLGPLLTLMRTLVPGSVITTDGIGRAMLAVARRGTPGRVVLESAALKALADAPR